MIKTCSHIQESCLFKASKDSGHHKPSDSVFMPKRGVLRALTRKIVRSLIIAEDRFIASKHHVWLSATHPGSKSAPSPDPTPTPTFLLSSARQTMNARALSTRHCLLFSPSTAHTTKLSYLPKALPHYEISLVHIF